MSDMQGDFPNPYGRRASDRAPQPRRQFWEFNLGHLLTILSLIGFAIGGVFDAGAQIRGATDRFTNLERAQVETSNVLAALEIKLDSATAENKKQVSDVLAVLEKTVEKESRRSEADVQDIRIRLGSFESRLDELIGRKMSPSSVVPAMPAVPDRRPPDRRGDEQMPSMRTSPG